MKTILTDLEFNRLAAGMKRASRESLDAARLVLVQGNRPSFAADLNGISRQRLNGVLATFKKAFYPPGWRFVEVWLPSALADEVEALAGLSLKEESQPQA